MRDRIRAPVGVVLITLDTARADRLSPYGFGDATRDLLERAIVIVTADHGESLGEHREMDHGIFLYESVLRVPLIVRAGLAPRRVAEVVRLTDVMPTILDLLRLPLPALDGTSLVDVMRGHGGPELEAYAESLYPERHGWAPLFSLRSDRFKFIDAPRPELYDLRLDPFEQRNIVGQRQSLVAALQARLRTQVRREPSTAAKDRVPDELRTRLAALGVRRWPRPEARTGAFLPDPKTAPACSNRAAASRRTPTSDLWTHPGDIRIHCMTVRAEAGQEPRG